MPHRVQRTPQDARDFTVPITGTDGISRDRVPFRHNETHLFHYSKRDEAHVAIPKQQLLPEGMWDACAYLTAAAEAEGVSVSTLIARLRAEMPEQLQAASDLDGMTTKAPTGPDLMESGNHASSSNRDRQKDA